MTMAAPNVVAATECCVLARTLAALGGKATAEKIARCLGLQPSAVYRRLKASSGVADKLGDWIYFALSQTGDRTWGLTSAGVGLAHQEADAVPGLFADGTRPPAHRREPPRTAKCPECGQVRDLSLECARRYAYMRSRNKPTPMCASCSRKGTHGRKPKKIRVGHVPSAVAAGDPAQPTRTQPGSLARIELYQARIALRLPLFVKGDLGYSVGASRLANMLDDERTATEGRPLVEGDVEDAA